MADLPRVSVVMPVRDEERFIARSLGAVLAQDYPPELVEVLVADGGSRDRTREIVRELGRGRDVRVVDNPRGIVAPGLNAAIREARGEVVVRVDGHCEVPPGYLRRAVSHLSSGEVDGVGGPVETVGETPVARAIAAAMSSPFGVGGSAFRTGVREPTPADTVPFPAYPRKVLERAGPFDEELVRNQDDEYNYRLRRAGGKLVLDPEMRSRYFSRTGWKALFRQHFQYGFWKVRVMQKHPRQMRARQFVPPAFVAAVAGGLLAAPWSVLGKVFLGGTLGLYLAAALAASLAAARAAGWRSLPALPAAFAVLHLGYGLGFWTGLVRFAPRWLDP